jgi:Dolichyl-phosphate-mannose-protein mannosyltransferase
MADNRAMDAASRPAAEAEPSDKQEPSSKPAPSATGATALPDFALWPVTAVAGLLTAALIAFSDRYGYHRDELYFIQCGKHLAWGYPDQPPLVPLIARLMTDLAPGSLVLLRLPSAIAGGLLVVLTSLLTRELGGRRTAQVLAGAVIAVAPVVLGTSHLLSTSTFDLPAWALLCLILLRILRTGESRLWPLAGLVAGVGLMNNDLVASLIAAVVVGLAITGPRWMFRSGWFYAGGVIAVALWFPYLAWQASHGWPELALEHSIAAGNSGSSAPWWLIVPEQLALVPVYFAPVWIAGLVRLFRDPGLRWCRAVGVAYPVLAVAFMVAGGKPYYLAGMFPVLLAAGAQSAVDWVGRARKRRRRLIAAGLVLSLLDLPTSLPVLPVSVVHDTPVVALNYDLGETIAWPTFVGEIAAAYRSLPAAQRAHAIVLTRNYGEAGAVDRFGPADGLPAAYSGHNAFWYWGPPPASATTAVVVGYDRSQLGFCRSVRLAVTLNNHLGINNQEQGAPVWICQPSRSWAAIWPSLRLFG